MPDRAHRLPCPVCLGVTMQKAVVGAGPGVEIDICRRCGGLWLEHGEVQQLRSHRHTEVRVHFGPDATHQVSQCHNCHAPMDRDAAQCPACGHANHLDCPHCDRVMQVIRRGPLRLDICEHCKGTWFDHHELEAIWGPQFDLALQRRNLERSELGVTAGMVPDLVLHALFYSPDLMLLGGAAAGELAESTASVMAQLPDAVAASPEAASAAFEVITDAASGVFDVVIEIVAGLWG